MSTVRNRPSGLAVVGYGMTLVGFIQVAVTIAPHVAQRIPDAGTAAPAIGVAVALAADVVWAALGHTTIRVAQTRQWGAVWLFGGATGAAILASTVLLAAVGHMGPWSLIPACAALLLAADGVRGMLVVSPDTAAAIRGMAAEIRDARALARMEARRAAHEETIGGFKESARLAARTGGLAEIRVAVQRAEARAAEKLDRSERRHGEGVRAYREIMPGTPLVGPPGTPAQEWGATVTHLVPVPAQGGTERAEGVPEVVNTSTMTDEEKWACAADLRAKGLSWSEAAGVLNVPRSTVRNWVSKAATA
jgi:hypothetical protein